MVEIDKQIQSRKDFHLTKQITHLSCKEDQLLDIHNRLITTRIRHVLTISDLDKNTILNLIVKAIHMKNYPELYTARMTNHCLLMLFEKPSLRTRLSFEAAMEQMGGHAIFYSIQDSPLGVKEDIMDTAKCCSRFVDICMARSKDRKEVRDLAKYCSIPVINALDDFAHPCQILADVLTIAEQKLGANLESSPSSIELEKIKLAFFGDCRNNVTYDLMRVAAVIGFTCVVCGPKDYPVEDEVLEEVACLCKKSGAVVEYTDDIEKAIKDADIVYTDSWMSYHIPKSEEKERVSKFTPYQVNEKLLSKAKPDALFMNCLPASRGKEQTAGVIDGPQSIVYDQAENRLHAEKALLLYVKQGESIFKENVIEEEIRAERQVYSALSRVKTREKKHCVVALGGNALQVPDDEKSFQSIHTKINDTCAVLGNILRKGYQITVTHGNGPQIGDIKKQNQEVKDTVNMPLDVCGAMSQAEIGYLLEQSLSNTLNHIGFGNKPIVTLMTRVQVDENDRAFKNPTKPIGKFYSEEEASKMKDLTMRKDDRGRGYRQVVASPTPVRIMESDAIKMLTNQGYVCITAGGGGVPVVYDKKKNETRGVEAVIDKDKTSALLGEILDSDLFLILTDIDCVYLHMQDEEKKRPLRRLNVKDARRYLQEGQFGEGSMKPKIEAAIDFVVRTGKHAIIASLDNALSALDGKSGTLVVR